MSTPTQGPQEVREVFRRYIEQIVNAGDIALCDELVSDTCVIVRGGVQRIAGLNLGAEDGLGDVAEDTSDPTATANAAGTFASAAGLDSGPAPGAIEAMKLAVTSLRTSFPDYHHTIKMLAVDDDVVTFQLRLSATHAGEFLGIPATGRKLLVDEVGYARVRDGKMQELFAISDELGMLQQLGYSIRLDA